MLAAEPGHAGAQHGLGSIYYAGRGVQQDYGKVVKYTTLAAEQGYALAQCIPDSCNRTAFAFSKTARKQ